MFRAELKYRDVCSAPPKLRVVQRWGGVLGEWLRLRDLAKSSRADVVLTANGQLWSVLP